MLWTDQEGDFWSKASPEKDITFVSVMSKIREWVDVTASNKVCFAVTRMIAEEAIT